jgi:Tol biopolymer transport system component
MGEVYEARDAALDRRIAIKILPAAWLADQDRLSRFDREAKVLASLNHPYIAAIYGLAESDGQRGLVLEFVEGPTLAEKIAGRPLPVKEALGIALQLAEALTAAHDKGIVHRDLKPANVKVTSDGVVKVLDFGLAKVTADESPPSDSTTIADGTREGLVVGTAAYMSPEQARGLPVDRRTDTWAFGCVVYEMLTGRRAFDGGTATDRLAAILEREPDWAGLPASTPAGIRRLLARCLEKDPRRRLRDIADAGFDLEEALGKSGPAVQAALAAGPAGSLRRRKTWLTAGLAAVALGAVAWAIWLWAGATRPLPPTVTAITALRGNEAFPSLSPDGTQVAFSWDQEGTTDVYVQLIGSETPLRLTNDPAHERSVAWSPDGRHIAFIREEPDRDVLYLVSQIGGAVRKVADFAPGLRGGDCPPCVFVYPAVSWTPDSKWLAVAGLRQGSDSGIVLVAADGSSKRMLVSPTGSIRGFVSPAFSPDGRALAYGTCNGPLQCYLQVTELDNRLEPSGHPRQVSHRFEVINGVAWSGDGATLVFGAASVWLNTFHLWRVPASGASPPVRIDLAGTASSPTISAATGRLAFTRRSFDQDVWRFVDGRGPESIVSSTLGDYDAAFSPDGSKIAFVTDRGGAGSELWTANADGTGLTALTRGTEQTRGSPRWSPDGKTIAFDGKGENGQWQVFVVDAGGGAVRPLTAGSEGNFPNWSADGRWIYFASSRSGQTNVWRMTPSGGELAQVTSGGGTNPFESADGRTLYFRKGTGVSAMTLPNGPARSVVDQVRGWQFMPTDLGVYYIVGSGTVGTFDLRFQDFVKGTPRTLGTLQAAYPSNGLSVSPDGKVVLTSGVSRIDSDLMLIEHFR